MGKDSSSADSGANAVIPPKINSPEDLMNIGQEIKRLIQRKRQADEHLVELEARIHTLETDYFRQTMPYGSLISGLEGYLGLAAGSCGMGGSQSTVAPSSLRKSAYREVKDEARIFSNTSASSRRAVMLFNKYSTKQSKKPQVVYEDEDSDEAFIDDEPSSPARGSQKTSSASRSSRSRPANKRRK